APLPGACEPGQGLAAAGRYDDQRLVEGALDDRVARQASAGIRIEVSRERGIARPGHDQAGVGGTGRRRRRLLRRPRPRALDDERDGRGGGNGDHACCTDSESNAASWTLHPISFPFLQTLTCVPGTVNTLLQPSQGPRETFSSNRAHWACNRYRSRASIGP